MDNYFFDVNDGVITLVDGIVPDTTITSGPANGSVILSRSTTFTVESTEADADLECTLDGDPVDCSGGSVRLTGLTSGTHLFEATSTDGAGNEDATPASRTFTVPIDDADLRRFRGPWSQIVTGAAFDGTISAAKRRDAELRSTVSETTRIDLVVATRPSYGRIQVFLGNQSLGIRTLASETAGNKVVFRIARFDDPVSGVVRIVSLSDKEVRIDGLAVVTNPAPPPPRG